MSNPNNNTLPALDALLLHSLEESEMILCVKDNNKRVLRQNERCKTLCGDRENQLCADGCMEIYSQDDSQQWQQWGNRTYKNCHLHNSYFDVTLLCSDHYLVTILQPLGKKQEAAIEHYRNIGLSKRELGVITEAIAGLSNTEICTKLSISKSTLRTHLNTIYKKAQDAGGDLEHIPSERSGRR